MIIENLAIPTGVTRPGEKMAAFLEECVRCDVPGLPYVDETGQVVGRLSIRHFFKEDCVPPYMLNAAHLLGDDIQKVRIPHIKRSELLAEPVERYVLQNFPHISSRSPIIKGMAIMEQCNSSYLFVIDDGEYKGVVTRMGIARRLLEAPDETVI